jgi:MYXO-CTERM domain-containing protein
MNANATGDDDDEGADSGAVSAVAPDRPVVDGTKVSADELRAQVEVLDDDTLARVEELRGQVGATVGELAKRLDVPTRWRARREQLVDTVRTGALDGARTPAVLALAALVLVAVVRRRRRS